MRRFPFSAVGEFKIFERLGSPATVQDFLNTLPINFETNGETCRSPLEALRSGEAQCVEGALLAAAALWYHGRPPLLLDLETAPGDESHVLALYKERGHWGAVSKTNHAVLRFRDPVHQTIRELVLSYFNEYFLHNGKKTLHAFSKQPLDLTAFEDEWVTADYPVWGVYDGLVVAPHEKIAPSRLMKNLRAADAIEIEAGKLVEWRK
jgi:hypothetical protein